MSSIKPAPDNPRLIKDAKFKKLCDSIEQFPQMLSLRPMIVDEAGVILGGNMRYKALKHLGYKSIPSDWVKRAAELTEEQKQEFIIKDNVGFGEWDWDALANEWSADGLNKWGLNVPSFDDDMSNNADYSNLDQLDKLDKFMEAEVKRMFLVFDGETFPRVVEWFAQQRKDNGFDDNSQVVLNIINNG